MPITLDTRTLTPLETAAVERIIPDPPPAEPGQPAPQRETVAEYLARVGAGQQDLDNYVAALKADFNSQLTAASEALLAAGVSTEDIVALARGFAAATTSRREEVARLLLA